MYAVKYIQPNLHKKYKMPYMKRAELDQLQQQPNTIEVDVRRWQPIKM